MLKDMIKRTLILAAIIILAVFSVSLLSVGMTPEIALVFGIFILSFFVTIIQQMVKQIIWSHLILNIIIEYLAVSIFVFLYGYFVQWFSRSNWWMAFVYVALVYVPAYFLDMAIVNREIAYINAQLERRRKEC